MLVLSLVLSAHSAELHVEAGESIQAVLNEAEPGDRIVIAAGTYDEDLSTESSGEEDAKERERQVMSAMRTPIHRRLRLGWMELGSLRHTLWGKEGEVRQVPYHTKMKG